MSEVHTQRQRRARRIAAGILTAALGISFTAGTAFASTRAAEARAPYAAAKSATTAITADWVDFFSGKTSAARKIALLENGSRFASVIKAQAGSPLSSGVKANVLTVKVTSKTKATVRYTIDEDGTAALKNRSGTAVLQGGTWKVGDASFSALLGLEGSKPHACAKS